MKVTRQQISEVRQDDCHRSNEWILAAIEKRFPGGEPVDLAKLCDAWVADSSLSQQVLTDCAYLVCVLADKSKKQIHIAPRRRLTRMAAELRGTSDDGR
jgi:hypothetical protein